MDHAVTKHMERAARFHLASEGRGYRIAGLNLLTTIVIYWNTAHLGEAVRQRQHAGLTVEPGPSAHILLTRAYRWQSADSGVSVRFCPVPESTRFGGARWTTRIGLGEPVATTKTLRRRFFSLPGRITRKARRLTLHLPQGWPWQNQFNSALARLRALPLPS